jgi:hypothetical protein
VDGTLIEAWASLKSFQGKEQENGDEEKDRGNANVNFRGEKRSNQTHESKTDPDAKLARKGDGKEAKLSYNGNLENRNGLMWMRRSWKRRGQRSPVCSSIGRSRA